jgi:hypothetical protein
MSQATTVSAAVAGIMQGIISERSENSAVASDYTVEANVAAAIAAQIWASTLDVGASASSAALLTAICAGAMAGRQPTSVTATDYAVVALAIKAMYTEALTKITP